MAKKLHRALEHYPIPKDLRGRPGRDGPVPEKIFPVFRDRDELPLASDLGSTITDALRASRYLIVLCSPNSAKSRWVDEEIRTFKAMGREDRILALILDGEPNAADVPGQEDRECFPPCLKVRVGTDGVPTKEPVEPIGGDLRKGKDGWTAAFLKCVEGITGLGFNAFARRELRRKRIRQAVAAVALVAMTAAGIWFWDYTRLKTSRFESMVMRHGVPEGLHPVSDEDFARRYATFVFEETRRKVRRVKAVNRTSTPMPFSLTDAAQTANSEFGFPPSASSVSVNYREDGSVASHDIFDVTGRILLRHVYSADLRVVEMKNPGRDTAQTLEAGFASMGRRGSGGNLDGPTQSQKTEIARWRATYDDSGFIIEKAYGNAWGEPTADTDGKAMVRYTRNSDGRVITESVLDRDGGAVVETGTLVEGTKFEYNEKGRLSAIRFVDSGKNPVPGPLGYAIEQIVCDPQGNVLVRRFGDSNGQTIMRDDGFAIFKAAYDENGFIKLKSFFDSKDKPVTVPTLGFHMERYENDDQGRQISFSYFGVDDEPALEKNGVHRHEVKLDQLGRQLSLSYFGRDGQAVLHGTELWHRIDMNYDERGNLTEIAYFSADGKPMNANTGCHRIRITYDDANRVTGQRYLGVDNTPALSTDGFHEVRYAYDPRGNIKQFSYHGPDREPVLNKAGLHIYRQTFDERGNLIEYAHFGKREENVLDGDTRIHKTTYRYNARGQEIERRYFDAAGRAMNDPKQGYHLTRYEYNPKGVVAAEEWFDTEDQPVLRRSDRVHRYQNEHDGRAPDQGVLLRVGRFAHCLQ